MRFISARPLAWYLAIDGLIEAEIERATRTLRGTETVRADALSAANELFRDVVLGAQ